MTTPYVGRHRKPVPETRILLAAAGTGITILLFPLLTALAVLIGIAHQVGAL